MIKKYQDCVSNIYINEDSEMPIKLFNKLISIEYYNISLKLIIFFFLSVFMELLFNRMVNFVMDTMDEQHVCIKYCFKQENFLVKLLNLEIFERANL